MTIDPALLTLIERVRAARAERAPLDIVGGNTKAFYGGAPRGMPLDVRPLAGISSYEPSELVVTARAGTPLAELEAALADKGQCLPFEPPRLAAAGLACGVTSFAAGSAGVAASGPAPARVEITAADSAGTVGGMVAAGLAGPARAAAGSVRDYVLGVTLLGGRAEVMSFGGQVMKNVAGYDVSRLLVGSLGVLGVILEVSLKVLPVAPASATLRFELDQARALAQLNAWGGQPLPINASAWWNGTLVVRLAGAGAAVQAAQARLGGEVVEPALAARFWTGLRDQRDEFFTAAAQAVAGGATLWRLSLPSTALPLQLGGEPLIEWGGAQRWVATDAAIDAVRAAAARAGGHATVWRGDKSGGAFAPLSAPLARIHRELKTAFDPDRIFNPGRLYPDL